jgi:hypothetical protein
MPQRALHLAGRYSLLGLLLTSSIVAVALRAQDSTGIGAQATESFTNVAERFGLWAALCVVLVIASVYSLYNQSLFVHNTLVALVQANQRCIDRNTEALRDAPCGAAAAKAQDREESSHGN